MHGVLLSLFFVILSGFAQVYDCPTARTTTTQCENISNYTVATETTEHSALLKTNTALKARSAIQYIDLISYENMCRGY